mmetsp:Transcript_9354/g.27930  ORF Transcript_9354/g.27930 Transcript_9354/m.27930 type:complete len:226 (-) Transcript_9354:217-894(-)
MHARFACFAMSCIFYVLSSECSDIKVSQSCIMYCTRITRPNPCHAMPCGIGYQTSSSSEMSKSSSSSSSSLECFPSWLGIELDKSLPSSAILATTTGSLSNRLAATYRVSLLDRTIGTRSSSFLLRSLCWILGRVILRIPEETCARMPSRSMLSSLSSKDWENPDLVTTVEYFPWRVTGLPRTTRMLLLLLLPSRSMISRSRSRALKPGTSMVSSRPLLPKSSML